MHLDEPVAIFERDPFVNFHLVSPHSSSSWRWATSMRTAFGPLIFLWRRKSTAGPRRNNAPRSSAGSTERGSTGGFWRVWLTRSSSTRCNFLNKNFKTWFFFLFYFTEISLSRNRANVVSFSFNECTRLGPYSSEQFLIYIIFNSVNSTFFFPFRFNLCINYSAGRAASHTALV